MITAIAERIRALRTAQQMTQAQLADRLGVRYQTVSKWETGVSVPDTAMLPAIATLLGVSIDALFGRESHSCAVSLCEDDAAFLLQTYSRMYAPEAGPWNVSVENKYLEYRFADFFEKHFSITAQSAVCNIGIGAGEWDIYLSYQLSGGTLTSIDLREICCRQLERRLVCEENPAAVTVICADAMTLPLEGQFDLVTMVGSTAAESEDAPALLEKAMDFVREGGALYYQSLDATEDCSSVLQAAFRRGMTLDAFLTDDAYDMHCQYYKFRKIQHV